MATKFQSACVLLILGLPANAAEIGTGPTSPGLTSPGLTSPMMNNAIFREGQVQRLMGRFGAWTIVCDEVASLKQRYCSLRSFTLSANDGRSAFVEVSTGDDGKPAALLHLPVGVSLAFGVSVDAGPAEVKSARDTRAERKLTIATCDDRQCLAIWILRAVDIQALTTGHGVTLTFCTTGPGKLEFATNLRQKSCASKMVGMLPAAGFQKAIQASIR